MMKYYGRDLISYRDGMTMAADWQKEARVQWESGTPEELQATIKRHGQKMGAPEYPRSSRPARP